MTAGDNPDERVWNDDKTFKQARDNAICSKDDLPLNMHKYWRARHDLFSRFSEGILLDKESWFSVTPEAIAYRIACQCACKVVLDACCGAGGNTIQFAMTCEHVVAIDIDPLKLALAWNNACVYGVQDRITLLQGDFCDFARSYMEDTQDSDRWQGWNRRKIDVLFMSPPWGGVDYQNPMVKTGTEKPEQSCLYPLSKLKPLSGQELFCLARKICDNTVFYLPRNVDLHEVARLVQLIPDKKLTVHTEELWLGHKLKALAVYFSEAQ